MNTYCELDALLDLRDDSSGCVRGRPSPEWSLLSQHRDPVQPGCPGQATGDRPRGTDRWWQILRWEVDLGPQVLSGLQDELERWWQLPKAALLGLQVQGSRRQR